ncbi:GGDEF domain-containing protein [Aminipila terrae]|uniref:Diguanylate cyclase n=1 Tax=Aminipila terrae TaxID=2697030 RepID=A0A6P1MDV3_9FIRM|nr:GGDEF domain-containing protein [Aminipila terrae]QHI72011.1 diguanylate cyclase [Aminipila terrae]
MSVLIALGCITGRAFKVYKQNNEFVTKVLSKTFDSEYTHKQRIQELKKVQNLKLVAPRKKIEIYTNLSMVYALNQEYSKMIETGVTSIYMADKEKEYYYSSWNYINLADTFMMLYDYKMAETLIHKALSYEIKNPEEKRWIEETAYIYMADLKSKTGHTSESEAYLKSSMNYVVKPAYDYREMLSKRRIIQARNFWNERDYQSAKNILDGIVEPETKDELIISNVIIPLREMRAKMEIATGDLGKSQQMCDEVLTMQRIRGYSADSLNFLKEITPLYEEKSPAVYGKYSAQILDMYMAVMSQESQLSTDYIFTIYGSKYAKSQEKEARIRLILVVLIIFMVMLTLLILFLQSRKQSITDSLTNAYNRRHFEKVYNNYIRKKVRFAVIMIDVDYFKNVNDNYGHDFGDVVLSRLCRSFNERKSRNAKVFRMGGEEFCILYKCSKMGHAIGLAERLRLAVQEMKWEEDTRVTISVGMAFSGQAEDLYNLADKNLYQSKNSGRNKVTYTC